MQLIPYLNFNGRCEEAFRFYESAIGGKIAMMMKFGESPMAAEMPPESHNAILHASLEVEGATLLASDAPGGRYSTPAGMAVSLIVTDAARSEKIFNALAEGGTVTMPLQQTFWALRFGMLTDKFGIPWLINCDNPS